MAGSKGIFEVIVCDSRKALSQWKRIGFFGDPPPLGRY